METLNSEFSNNGVGSATDRQASPIQFDPFTFDLVPSAICLCDPRGVVLYCNAAARGLCADAVLPGRQLSLFDLDRTPLAWSDTPIAEVMRTRRPRLRVELVFDTARDPVRVIAHIDTLKDATGLTGGAIINFSGIGADPFDKASLSASDRQLREALDAIPTAVYMTDLSGRLTYYNQACVDLAGRTPVIGTDTWCVSWRLYWPDGNPMLHSECPMAIAMKEKRPVHAGEIMIERPDGARASCMAYPTPLRDASGAIIGAINILLDITKRKRADEHQELLINELNHRVKNTLATVLAIAAQSFRTSADKQMYRWFEGRLIALSKAHDVLAKENWTAADLHEIVEQTTAPLLNPARRQFEISGPRVSLRTKTALSLSMALHELCTNAAKYGALSTTAGRVAIRWHITEDAGRRLFLEWREQGGPAVVAPQRRGFGSRLIERGLARELGGKVELRYEPSGVVCEIETPL